MRYCSEYKHKREIKCNVDSVVDQISTMTTVAPLLLLILLPFMLPEAKGCPCVWGTKQDDYCNADFGEMIFVFTKYLTSD